MAPRAALLALAFLLAGCTVPSTPQGEDGMALLQAALVDGHDHTDPSLHPGASWRIAPVFATNLPTDGAALSPASEFVIHDGFAYVALFHPSSGIVILDLAEPERPRQVGRFDAGTAYVNDVEVSPDGRWAFLPTSPIETRENNPLGPGLTLLGDYGIQVVDVQDKANPTLATFWAAPDLARDPAQPRTLVSGLGYHRVDLEVIQGSLYAFGASLGYPRVDILRFDEAPPRLTLVSTYLSEDARDPTMDHGSNPNAHGVHDVTVDPDPLEGFPLMAVAHWRSGAHFVDVRDPANPVFLGRWHDFPIAGGNVHNVEFTAIEGRRIAVAVPEYPAGDDHQGGVWVLDATDFAAIAHVGTWRLPGAHPLGEDPVPAQGNWVFSTDRVLLRNGTIFDAHFHAGTIVLDISTLAKARAPELLGFVLPEGQARVPYANVEANPYIYDAIPYGDLLYSTDLTGGIHVARMAPEVVRGNAWTG
jgi:hypothetical protein